MHYLVDMGTDLLTLSAAPTVGPPDEPPPAYEGFTPPLDCKDLYSYPRTASPAERSSQAGPVPSVGPSMASLRGTADDPYEFLGIFDTILLIDDSGSMYGPLGDEARDALRAIAPFCTQYDADGVDIHFLNHATFYSNVTSASAVYEIFSTVTPRGGTWTGQKLQYILTRYLALYEAEPETTKPINIICITDGAPSDDVESPLIRCAKKLDRLDAPAWQVGVQFFQIGNDVQAQKHLKQLDDDLGEISGNTEIRDMIDTVPFQSDGRQLTGDGILKVALGAVMRRWDRTNKHLHQ